MKHIFWHIWYHMILVGLVCYGSVTLHALQKAQTNHIIDVTLNRKQLMNPNTQADWVIVGAGPAGIISVGLLLEIGVPAHRITWVDPAFNVGRLSSYPAVPSNNKTKYFIEFINACKVFRDCRGPAINKLNAANPAIEHPLEIVIEPLKEISQYLRTKVRSIVGQLDTLYFEDNVWHVGVGRTCIRSTHVILASGSHPRRLDYDCEKEISLDSALDPVQLKEQVSPHDTIVVVGSSHSAILLLKYLSELKVERIINLYKQPLKYAIDKGTWILHSNSGLNGSTARWAREVLEKNPPKNIDRLKNTQENRDKALQVCTKIIYAVGFERNELPSIPQNPKLTYNERSGVIAPRLFGIGIAFPEKIIDPLGNVEYKVGLTSFLRYAQRVIPYWVGKRAGHIEKQLDCLKKFEQLFSVNIL